MSDRGAQDLAARKCAPCEGGTAPLTAQEAGALRAVQSGKAARDADLLYTDVWISMGKESEAAERIKILKGYQINEKLVKLAKPDALVMHCLPAYRGKEIDEATFEANANTIFTQAENRLHVQKAIMSWAVG